MKDVILVQFEMKYETGLENICVAANMRIANEYVYRVKNEFPDLYGDGHGRFYFTQVCLIEE